MKKSSFSNMFSIFLVILKFDIFSITNSTYVSLQDQKYIMLRFWLLESVTYSQSRHVDKYFQQVSCNFDKKLDFRWIFKVEKYLISHVTLFWENKPYTVGLYNAANYLGR